MQPGPAVSLLGWLRTMVVYVALLNSKEADMASSSCAVLRVATVKPHVRVVAVTTGPSKQETEGGGGGDADMRGGALTNAPSTLPSRLEGVLAGVGLLSAGAGNATRVAPGPVGVIGAGAGARVGVGTSGDGAKAGGCSGDGAGAGGILHCLDAPAGNLHVSVHCDDCTSLTVEACTKFCPHRKRPRSGSRSVQEPLEIS